MSVAKDQQVVSFRRAARAFLWAANAACAFALTVLVMTAIVVALRGDRMADASLLRLALASAPALFYLAALLFARKLFATLATEGVTFGATVVLALRRIGQALACGGFISCLAGLYLMFSGARGMGGFAGLLAPGVTIAIVGAALVAIARLIAHADDIRRKNTSLSAELEGFV